MSTTSSRPSTILFQGKKYNLDPQVHYNSNGYCLVTVRDVELKDLETKKGDTFTITKVKFQFRGYDSMGTLTDQMTFYEDFINENLLTKGCPTLKSYIYEALGIKELPTFEVVDLEVDRSDESDGDFFEPLGDLVEEEAIEPLEEKYKLSKVLPEYYGKSFIAVLTRDNTKTGKYSNAGYLSIVPASVLALPTKKKIVRSKNPTNT